MSKKLLIICGPTASGKSYLGHYLAKIHNGEIINGDSMQIYQQIPIITASPAQIYRDELPYHLYNFLSINQKFSVIKYVNLAVEKITDITNRGKLPIIIGGTGLYINSLIYGYNEMPAISLDTKQYVKELHSSLGQIEFFNKLIELDPVAKQKLNQLDSQRAIRAYEILMQTGQSIFTLQTLPNILPLAEFAQKIIFLHPEREFLYQTCYDRITKLFSGSAIEEIKQLITDFPEENISSIKAIGVQQIIAYLADKITLQQSIDLAQIKTKQYAKRQITWFKNQITTKTTLEYSNNQQLQKLLKDLPI